MTRHLIRIGAAVMTTLLVLVVLWQFRIVVIYTIISLMLAAALRPLVNRLDGKGFVIKAAWVLLYLVILGCVLFLFFILIENAIFEIQLFAQSISVQDKWILPKWLDSSLIQQWFVAQLPTPSKLLEALTGHQGEFILPAIIGFSQGIGSFASDIFVIMFLSIYWSISQVHFERLWLSLFPSDQRRQARGIWRKIESEIGAYIRGQVFQSFIAALILGFGYWMIGSPYPVFLALSGVFACLIPVVGVVMAIIPPLIVGLLTSIQLSLFTGLFTLIFLIVLLIWIKPGLFNRRWDNPILTIVVLIALADAFGIIGIIVAPPVSIIGQILWSRLVSHRRASEDSAQVSDLIERQERLIAKIRDMEEPPISLVTSSMERLSLLIKKAGPILQTAQSPDADSFNSQN